MATYPLVTRMATGDDEKPVPVEETSSVREVPTSEDEDIAILGNTSPGVRRIEVLSSSFTLLDRIFFFFGIFLLAFSYGLDSNIRYTYQPLATASYKSHSLLATVNVMKAVIAAATHPTAAKIADVFGRAEVLLVSIAFYVLGTIIEATAKNVQSFAAGAALYQIGYTGMVLLAEVFIADSTSLRYRLLASYIPASSFLIHTWISGNVTSAVLKRMTWHWGIGMWAIILPVCALPLLISILVVHLRAKKAGLLNKYQTTSQLLGWRKLSAALFSQLDVIGIFLLVATFALILIPFTAAGGVVRQWQKPKIWVSLLVGFLLLPVFIFWETKCKHPLLPFKLLKDRAVWGALGLAISFNAAWYMQGDFLTSILIVAFDESIKSATRITSLFSFASTITGCILGLVVLKVRRLKPFILFGTGLFFVAFGLLIYFRGGAASSAHAGIIGAQILLGISAGFFTYPAQTSIQAATKHEHVAVVTDVAVVTGVYLACYNIGGAVGNSISGVIWNQLLPAALESRLGDKQKAALIYADPLSWAPKNPVGTPDRNAVIDAYKSIQKLLCITGICMTVLLIFFALCLRDKKLTDEQSFANAEKSDV